MKQTEINELLKNVEQNNAEVERINRQSSEQRGFVKASIGEVKKQIEALNKAGYQIDFKLVDDTTISPETLAQFKAVASQIVRETKQQNDRVGRIVEAVENADYDAIKELTGQDVTAVNYDIKLDDVDSIKVQAKAIADQDESTILTTEATEALEIDTDDEAKTEQAEATGNGAEPDDDFDLDEVGTEQDEATEEVEEEKEVSESRPTVVNSNNNVNNDDDDFDLDDDDYEFGDVFDDDLDDDDEEVEEVEDDDEVIEDDVEVIEDDVEVEETDMEADKEEDLDEVEQPDDLLVDDLF